MSAKKNSNEQGSVGGTLENEGPDPGASGPSLLDEQERRRVLLDHFRYAAFLLDRSGRILEINESGARQLGKERGQLVGSQIFEHIPPEKTRARRARHEEVVAKGETLSFEEEDGGRWIQYLLQPILDRRGRVIAVANSGSDITDRKKAEERARLQEKQVSQAAKMVSLGTLVSGVAHEINNPTNFIMMNTPLLREAWEMAVPVLDEYYERNGDFDLAGLPYSQMRENVPVLFSGIQEGANRIERIIGDLKNFARQDITESWEELEIKAVVESAISLLTHFIKRCTDHLTVELGRNVPKVDGNYQKLEQVVINLIQNACLALPDRTKRVTVTTFYDVARDAVELTVSDEGCGIAEENLPHVMDPFFTTRRKSGGTGLGLSISSKIVKEHGGVITVSSTVGQGSAFVVTLPQRAKIPRTKILVVDDEDSLRKIMVKTLRRNRLHVVEEASNGVEACIKLGTYRPDLLIIDINMPEMDGSEVCRWIKSEKALAGMKVVVVTGHPGSAALREIRGMGYDNFLIKPFSPDSLSEMVRKVMSE